MSKFYELYNNKQQEKFLTTARTLDLIKSESEFYISGIWFSYDEKENSSLLENEKEMKGIKFPEIAKVRERIIFNTKENTNWIS